MSKSAHAHKKRRSLSPEPRQKPSIDGPREYSLCLTRQSAKSVNRLTGHGRIARRNAAKLAQSVGALLHLLGLRLLLLSLLLSLKLSLSLVVRNNN